MSDPAHDEAKNILIHIVAPVSGASIAFGMSLDQSGIGQAVAMIVAGAMLLFYGFSSTIEISDHRLNDKDASGVNDV